MALVPSDLIINSHVDFEREEIHLDICNGRDFGVEIIKVKDQHIRDSLIKLGWTPPPDKE